MLTPPERSRPTRAIVCVPARNEESHIGRLLASLARQTVASPEYPLKVAVVINNTTDATPQIVQSFARDPRLAIRSITVTLPLESAHAGMARRLVMDAGAGWLDEDAISGGVLISTDADAIAPPEWVAANLAALAGADLVGGRLVIAKSDDACEAHAALHASIERYWAAVRALEDRLDPPTHDPAPRHGDHTGASLALRATLYRAVGGVPLVASGEDNALVNAVLRIGGQVRHCPAVWIEVSTREIGRCDGGMAQEMMRRRTALAAAEPYLLPSGGYWRAQILRRAAWRAQWPSKGGDLPNAIAYVASREAGAIVDPPCLVRIDEAIDELEAMAAPPVCVGAR